MFSIVLVAAHRQADAETKDAAVDPAVADPATADPAAADPATVNPNTVFVGTGDSPPQTRKETQKALDARIRKLEQQLAGRDKDLKKAKLKALKKPTIRFNGRIMTDWVHYSQDSDNEAAVGNLRNGGEFRRVRLGAKGRLYKTRFYEWELDFSGAEIEYKDLYVGMDDLGCLGTIVIGHFKEPFSLEELNSSKYFSLLERGLPNVFAPSRRLGIASYHIAEDQNSTFAIGTFNTNLIETDGAYQDDNGGQDVTARLTWLPWYDEPSEGRYLFHLGLNYSYQSIANDVVRFRQRPEAHLSGVRFVDTGDIDSNQFQLFGVEAAMVNGPFSFHSEYIATLIDQKAGEDLWLYGAYLTVSYFLTGENRVFDREAAEFDRVKPNTSVVDFDDDGEVCHGSGAWEVAARWSYLDLNDENITGGRIRNFTVGLNWYMTPYTKIMFNYVRAELNRGGLESNADIFAVRAQLDFK